MPLLSALRVGPRLGRLTSRGRVQLAVWALLIAVLLTGFGLTATAGPATSSPAASTVAGPVSGAPAGSDLSTSTGVQADPPAAPAPLLNGLDTQYNRDNAIDLLPAWRWQYSAKLYTNLSTFAIAESVTSALAGMLFMIASFVWMVLLGLLRFGLTMDLLEAAGDGINKGFAALTKSIWASGAVWIIILLGMATAARMLMTGRGSRMIATCLAIFLPIGAMQALATNAAQSGATPKGSPSWVALKTTQFINDVATGLGTGFGYAGDAVNLKSVIPQTKDKPDCYSYTQALYTQYGAYSRGAVPDLSPDQERIIEHGSPAAEKIFEQQRKLAENAANDYRNSESVATVSYLWERAFLGFYTHAQMGNTQIGDRAICHVLEDNAYVPAKEQAKIAKIAGYPLKDEKGQPASKVFQTQDGKQWEANMLSWGVCYYDGKEWHSTAGAKAADADDASCQDWWSNGTQAKMQWDDRGDIKDDLKDDDDYNQAADNRPAGQVTELRQAALALRGDNAASRFLNALLSLITALFYGYALGSLAIGTIIGKLGGVLMAVLLAGTLTLLAMRGKEGSAASGAGKRLLRITGVFWAADFIIVFMITLLIQMISMFEALTAPFAGVLEGLLHGVIPLVALYILKKLAEKIGLGNIASLSGAVGLTTAAAIASGGDARGRGKWNKHAAQSVADKANQFGDKTGINRADAWAKDRAKKAGLWAPKKAATLGVKGAQAAGEFAGVDSAKRMLLGSKDADGNRTQLGLLQQMNAIKSRAGWSAATAVADKIGLPSIGERTARRAAYHAERAELAAAQRADNKKHLLATAFRGKQARIEAASRRFEEQEGLMNVRRQMISDEEFVRDADGQIKRDDHGGYYVRNSAGAERAIAPRGLTFSESIDNLRNVMEEHQLKEQQLVSNQYGLGATYLPTLRGDSKTAQLVKTKTFESTLQLATDGRQYLADHLKVMPAHWTADQKSTYLHLLDQAAGLVDPATGAKVDFLMENGFDINQSSTQEMIRENLAGRATALDALQGTVDVGATVHRSLLARVERMGKGGEDRFQLSLTAGTVRRQDVEVRVESATQMRDDLKDAQQELNSRKFEFGQLANKLSQNGDAVQKVKLTYEAKAAQLPAVKAKLKAEVSDAAFDAAVAEQKVREVLSKIADPSNADSKLQAQLQKELDSARTAASAATTAADLARNAAEAKLKQIEQDIADANRKVQAEVDKRGEIDREMREVVAQINEISHEAAQAAAEARKEAHGLELIHEYWLADKQGKDVTPVFEAAELFDKTFAEKKAALVNQALAAQAAVLEALDSGDLRAASAGLDQLERFVNQETRAMDKATSEAIGRHQKLTTAEVEEIVRNNQDRARFGTTPTERRSARTVVRTRQTV